VTNGRKVARIGGEEFAILLPDTDLEGATIAAKRCKEALQAQRLRRAQGQDLGITISMGVAILPDVETILDNGIVIPGNAENAYSGLSRKAALKKLLKDLGDSAMYKAKEAGRDRTVLPVVEKGNKMVKYKVLG
jgi:GGDEF domain-containing protein